MQYLLLIDTSTDTGMVAISGDGVVLASAANAESRNHAAAINNMIEQVLAEAKIKLAHVAGVVVCAGPGSYTGLRIGMATAKGLCYALNKPLMAQNRLELLAQKANKKHGTSYSQYVTLLVARDKEYFIGVYDGEMRCVAAPRHIMEQQLDELVNKAEKAYIITNADPTVVEDMKMVHALTDTDIQIDLASWAGYAFEKYICNETVNLRDAEPFYLKQVYTHK